MMKFIVEGMSLKDIHEQIIESAQHILKTEIQKPTGNPFAVASNVSVAVPAVERVEESGLTEAHKPRVRRTKAQIDADEKPTIVEAPPAPTAGADIVSLPTTKAQCQGLLKDICEMYNIDKAREVLARFKVASVSDMKEYQYAEFAGYCRQILDQKNLE